MAEGRRRHLSDATSRRQSTSSARAGILRVAVCIAAALPQSALVRAQDAAPKVPPEPTILPELSKRTGPEAMKADGTPIPETETPSIEISAGAPREKPAPIVKQTPSLQPKAPKPIQPNVLTLSALKAVATSAPVPDYPYQAKRAGISGSGICILLVDSTNGKVTSATMAQSTGSQILDKVTTATLRKWRFKPGTVSQVKVPISYE